MAIIIKTNTEALINTAEQFSTAASKISGQTQQMTEIVKSLTGQVWEGEASQAYVTKFDGLQDDIAKLNKMIQEHVEDLEAIARNYDAAETENVTEVQGLSSDVLV